MGKRNQVNKAKKAPNPLKAKLNKVEVVSTKAKKEKASGAPAPGRKTTTALNADQALGAVQKLFDEAIERTKEISLLQAGQYGEWFNAVFRDFAGIRDLSVRAGGQEAYAVTMDRVGEALKGILADRAAFYGGLFHDDPPEHGWDDQTLALYSGAWERFHREVWLLHTLCRHYSLYVADAREHGRDDLSYLCSAGAASWKEKVFSRISTTSATGSALELIRRHRRGEETDMGQVRSLVEAFNAMARRLGTVAWKETEDLSDYKAHLETAMLKETRTFYVDWSKDKAAEMGAEEYMEFAEAALNREEEMIDKYLRPSSKEAMMQACADGLVKDHLEVFVPHVARLLKSESVGDLARMHRLVKRAPEGFEGMIEQWGSYVLARGTKALNANFVEGHGPAKRINLFVKTCCRNIDKFKSILVQAFDYSYKFSGAMDRSCIDFVNNSKFAPGAERAADALSRHCQLTMTSDKNFEERRGMTRKLLPYLTKKTSFESKYRQCMAGRIRDGTYGSLEKEVAMIDVLQGLEGFGFVQNLRLLALDLSKTEAYNAEKGEELGEATLLNAGSQSGNKPVVYDDDKMREEQERKMAEWEREHPGKRVSLDLNGSRCEFTTRLFGVPRRMALTVGKKRVLDVFKGREECGEEEMMGLVADRVDERVFRLALRSLVKAKVLVKGEGEEEGGVFRVNKDWEKIDTSVKV